MLAVVSALIIQQCFGNLVPRHISSVAFTLFVTSALLITAVPVLARILDETGFTRTYVGGWALAIAVYVDFVAFTIAGIAGPLAKSHLSAEVLEGPAVLVGTFVLCHLLAPAAARITRQEIKLAVAVAALALALAAASATNASTLVAAFIIGAVLWRRMIAAERESAVSTASNGGPNALLRALVPIYIVYSGFQVNLRALTHSNLLLAAAVVLVLAVLGKVLASLLAARVLGFDRYQARILAVLGNTRGLTELILISLGHSAGILSDGAYSILFLMTLVTTAGSGVLARIVVSDKARALHAPFETTIAATGE
jgi:Kef-type K+ transport system membrane component KefB